MSADMKGRIIMKEKELIFSTKNYCYDENIFDEYLLVYQQDLRNLRRSLDVMNDTDSSFLESMKIYTLDSADKVLQEDSGYRLFASTKDIFCRKNPFVFLNVFLDKESKLYFEYQIENYLINSKVFLLREPHAIFKALICTRTTLKDITKELPQLAIKR